MMKNEVIEKGSIGGYKYYIVENSMTFINHPYDFKWYCCYVAVPKKNKLNYDDLEVHGGITFNGYLPHICKGLRYVIGWDYNHASDVVFPQENGTDFIKTKLQLMDKDERLTILYNDVLNFVKEYLL